MASIRAALIGVGNCASSLIQGRYHYEVANSDQGLIHGEVGGYRVSDVEFVLGYDVDARKVGVDLGEAIFAQPNCTAVFHRDVPRIGIPVKMGRVLDGVAGHMTDVAGGRGFQLSSEAEPDQAQVVADLRAANVDVLINFLPVGSEEATKFYMECALEAGVAVVNCMPVFIASNPEWAERFAAAGVPIIGDDVKAQLGATIVHRTLSHLFRQRGVTINRTYQLNTGGNTDFMNMLDRNRLTSKKESKTEAVQSVLAERLDDSSIHVGPSDYIPWLGDNKLCFLRIEGELFGGVPMNVELRLSVEDSPNSAAVVMDAIRCCKVASDRGQGGILVGPSSFFCKHPPEQYSDDVACRLTEEFIAAPTSLAAE